MSDASSNEQPAPLRIGGDAFDARVVLVGRTGQDAALRLDPTVELIRVRTGFDAVGELANPLGDVPGRTVVIVGSGSDIDKRNGGDDAFVSAARMVAPDAVVLRTAESVANPAAADAYDGVVPSSASSDNVREMVHGRSESDPPLDAHPQPEPEPETAGPPRNGPEIWVSPDAGDMASERAAERADQDAGGDANTSGSPNALAGATREALERATPAPGSTNGTLIHDSADGESVNGSVAAEVPSLGRPDLDLKSEAETEGLDEEELALLREPEPTLSNEPEGPATAGAGLQAAPSPETPEPPQAGGDGDDVLVAAALGGRDILEPAMGLIRARVGRSDVEFVPHTDGESGDGSAGAEVAWSGRRYGSLRVESADPGLSTTPSHGPGHGPSDGPADDTSRRLAHSARWLGTWLALAEQHRRLRLEAYTDPVSGAWNRRYFERFLEAALPHARRRRHKLTVLVFDLDNFKSFNDRFGHHAGDMILSETVRLLRSMTRPTDRICRIGGDEFAVVFYEPDGPRDLHSDHPHQFEMVSERFQKAVQEQRFPKLGIEAPGELSISGGLATFPWDGQTPEELLRRADELALASKAAGKNQITLGPRDGGPH
ncbi:MAG: diguanylate cyclase [Planctomycetota bacterium]